MDFVECLPLVSTIAYRIIRDKINTVECCKSNELTFWNFFCRGVLAMYTGGDEKSSSDRELRNDSWQLRFSWMFHEFFLFESEIIAQYQRAARSDWGNAYSWSTKKPPPKPSPKPTPTPLSS
jgi:hypothetical protein